MPCILLLNAQPTCLPQRMCREVADRNKAELKKTPKYMTGETNLRTLIRSMQPKLNAGEYVFCSVHPDTMAQLPTGEIIGFFRELEGITLVLSRETAERHQLPYHFVAAWITLNVHSALEAVGLTAAFSQALADQNISCNVLAGYYHDHIFVDKKDAENALAVLEQLSRSV